MKTSEYASHDALGLAALVARGEVSPGELVETAIAELDPALNAVIHESYERSGTAHGHWADGDAFVQQGIPVKEGVVSDADDIARASAGRAG